MLQEGTGCVVLSCHERERSRGGVGDVALAWRAWRCSDLLGGNPETSQVQGCGSGEVWTSSKLQS